MIQDKVNIAELLKDCPKGMQLDCTMFDDNCVEFSDIVDSKFLPIRCRIKKSDGGYNFYDFTKYGCWIDDDKAKCVIFPKGKTTWEGFQRPFKDGDVIYTDNFIAILSHIAESGAVWYHCYYCISTKNFNAKHYCGIGNINNDEFRFATEGEKAKLFQAIKDNGRKWNPETNTLEKLPRFKVGNKIKSKTSENIFTVIDIRDGVYILSHTDDKFGYHVPFRLEKDYELIPNKFDITTLKPFESRVLMRSSNAREWVGTIYSHYNNNKFYGCGMCCDQCIPYEGNEHLLGKTDYCDEYFKNW